MSINAMLSWAFTAVLALAIVAPSLPAAADADDPAAVARRAAASIVAHPR